MPPLTTRYITTLNFLDLLCRLENSGTTDLAMEDRKQAVAMELSPDPAAFQDSLGTEKKGTAPDQYDMQRMGKTQQTKVGLVIFGPMFKEKS